MKNLTAKKTMAAKVLDVGVNKVWFDPSRLPEIKEAITKQDIADLIKDKAIKKKPNKGVKRRAGKLKLKRKRKGRRRNDGKIKFRIKKQDYHKRIRKLRNFLKTFKINKKITNEQYTQAYGWLKAGVIKNKQGIIEKLNLKQN
jgi:large subunit ribosomal protein L19e